MALGLHGSITSAARAKLAEMNTVNAVLNRFRDKYVRGSDASRRADQIERAFDLYARPRTRAQFRSPAHFASCWPESRPNARAIRGLSFRPEMASVRSVDFQKPGGLSPLNSPNCESRGARVNAALDAPLQEIVDLPASLRPAAELPRQMAAA